MAAQLPVNLFKKRLSSGHVQVGLWVSLANAYSTEIVAGAGFDWLLIDAEHGPNDLRSVLAQLQVLAGGTAQPIVRVPVGDAVLIKQYLDIGCQTLLVPMVESAKQAADLVRAMRYPPTGIRGVGSALARASRWSRVPGYARAADREMCLLVQVESRRGLDALDAIAATPGVDGVFIGPADLSASMGRLGEPGHPEVIAAIGDALARLKRIGRPAGIIAFDEAQAARHLEEGYAFVAVGSDVTILVRGVDALAARFVSKAD